MLGLGLGLGLGVGFGFGLGLGFARSYVESKANVAGQHGHICQ